MSTFVLVHGAWHGGWCWARVEPLLRRSGHRVLAPTLTGLGDRAHLSTPLVGLDTHVQDLAATLRCEEVHDCVLVGHSYAGQVLAGLASVHPELVERLVYLDAFVPEHGERAIDLLPQEIAEHYRSSAEERGAGWLVPPRSLQVLGVTEPADVAWLTAHLVAHPLRTYTDPATVTSGSRDVPSAFIECVDWLGVFRPYADRARRLGWPVRELASGHEAMVTAPRALATALEELAAA